MSSVPDRPNLLFIITDQQRFDTVGALGNPHIRTPALDRLTREGTAFTQAFSPSPECVPARCAFTHGQYPAQTGCYGNGWHFPEDGRDSLMTVLNRAGYRTHGIGKYHFEYPDYAKCMERNGFQNREVQEELSALPEKDDYLQFLWKAGFEEITDPNGVRGDMYYMPQPAMMPQACHPTQWVGDRATAFLEDQAEKDPPWYGFISFIHPHPPFAPPSPWHKLYRGVDMPDPHRPEGFEDNWVYLNHFQNRYKRYDRGYDFHRLRMIRAYYYACISFVDYQVGRILDTLDETGQAGNTLIVFTSDHGELLGDFGAVGKRTYHDPASRVPMILRHPGHIPAGHRCETPVDLIDITRTFSAVGSAPFETHTCEGTNLVDLANQPDMERTLFSQLFCEGRGLYTAVSRNWKYVYSAPDQRELFFDRQTDPGESTDLADSADTETAAARKQMKSALFRHLERTGETAAMENGDWKLFPVLTVPEDPDEGLLYQDHPWVKPHPATEGYRGEKGSGGTRFNFPPAGK